jgi:hypothetical protein
MQVRAIVFNLFSLIFFSIAALVIWADSTSVGVGKSGIAFLCAAFCGLVGNLDRIDTLKATPAGIEAKTREIKAVVDDARATINQLHSLAVEIGVLIVDLSAGAGRFGGAGTPQNVDERKERLIATLKKLGVDDATMLKVRLGDQVWTSIDYFQGLTNGWGTNLTQEEQNEVTSLITSFHNTLNRPSPDECELILQRLKIDNPERWELLKDYRYYLATGQQRRPEVWSQRMNWN